MESVRSVLSHQFSFLQEEDLNALLAEASLLKLKHRDAVLTEGDKIEYLYFIYRGMVRGYYITATGEERTIILRPTNTFFSPPGVLSGAENSKYTYETIQDTELLIIPLETFINLSEKEHRISRLHVEILTENLQTVFFRVELLASMSPEQRYETLLDQRPELFQKSYHKYVANYLGITPNSLSRIIKRKIQKV